MDDSLNRADPIGEDDSEVTMGLNDVLIPALPTVLIIDAVSRLSAKDACKMKVLSKEWLSFISSNSEFKKLHRLRARERPSLLVVAKVVNYCASPGLFVEDDVTPLRPPMTREAEDFGGRKVVFNFMLPFAYLQEFVASCRDLMCFYSCEVVYVYSPSTNQYLRFDATYAFPEHNFFRVGLVYVASKNLYKIVKLEINDTCRSHVTGDASPSTIRFDAITIQDEEDEPQCGRGGRCDVDEPHTSAWEFISEHVAPSIVGGRDGGNFICVNGVVYVIVSFSYPEELQVLSLGFEEDNKQNHSFKMFSLPDAACYKRYCKTCDLTLQLSEVKDLLCFPHSNISSIDLWLLKDRYTCLWFKGYTINYMPLPHHTLGSLVYFPDPTTTVCDEDGDDANDGTGLFVFAFGDQIFQYDIRTKESRLLLQEKEFFQLHVFSDNLYSLKNSLSCTRMPFPPPPPWMREPRRPPPRPLPQRFIARHPQILLPPQIKRRKLLDSSGSVPLE